MRGKIKYAKYRWSEAEDMGFIEFGKLNELIIETEDTDAEGNKMTASVHVLTPEKLEKYWSLVLKDLKELEENEGNSIQQIVIGLNVDFGEYGDLYIFYI